MSKWSGWWRQLFGFCPKCNSDAPELYTCTVCNYDTQYPPNRITKLERWYKFSLEVIKEKEVNEH